MHKNNCKSLVTGFDQSCDCGSYTDHGDSVTFHIGNACPPIPGHNKRGKFEISSRVLEDIKSRKLLNEVFGKMIILRAESLYYKSCIEYIAESYLFDEVEEGRQIPLYQLKVNSAGWKFVKD